MIARASVLLCLVFGGCCASDGSCGFHAYGPMPDVAYQRMLKACEGKVRDWHKVILNPGAMALYGEYDYTCPNGTPGVQRWDEQGPKK